MDRLLIHRFERRSLNHVAAIDEQVVGIFSSCGFDQSRDLSQAARGRLGRVIVVRKQIAVQIGGPSSVIFSSAPCAKEASNNAARVARRVALGVPITSTSFSIIDLDEITIHEFYSVFGAAGAGAGFEGPGY